MNLEQQYWEAVQQKVCTKCIDGDGAGNCRLSECDFCGLKGHFPLVIKAINSINSNGLQEYVNELRIDVCSQCTKQSDDGKCSLRGHLDCGLDRYYPLIIEAIEEVNTHIKAAA